MGLNWIKYKVVEIAHTNKELMVQESLFGRRKDIKFLSLFSGH